MMLVLTLDTIVPLTNAMRRALVDAIWRPLERRHQARAPLSPKTLQALERRALVEKDHRRGVWLLTTEGERMRRREMR
jgi:hypothetical protein